MSREPRPVSANRRFGRVALVAVALGFLALLAAVAAVAWGFARTQEINRLVTHTYEVELALSDVRTLTERVETARRGFLIVADERFFRTFEETEDALRPLLDRVESLTADNPSQAARVGRLRAGIERQRAAVAASFDARRTSDPETVRQRFVATDEAQVIRDLRELAGEMVGEEQRLLAERRGSQQHSLDLSYAILGLAALALVAVAAGTIWAMRRNLAELQASRDSLADLNANLERAVETRTADLQRANDEIQRFAYIVSHDLRSPLVNVMGFTSELDAALKPLEELLDAAEVRMPQAVPGEARLAVREDLPEAIGFIRASTQKMDRLINAILRLSREGRRTIQPEALALDDIFEGVAASLAHRAGEIGAEITVAKPLPRLTSDRLAVEQIVSNLVENALKYTAKDRPPRIALRGRTERGRVLIEVEDNGRGIDPRDHERIFDLFRRSGPQDQPGEGIGLAHVRALAYRLGGTIGCRSVPGEGSTFALNLPAVFKQAKEG